MPSPFTYFPLLPNPPDDPGDDVAGMQINSTSINDLIGIDHIAFNNVLGGYHNVVHFNNQLADPAAIAGVGQEYTKTITPTAGTPDQQLFYRSGSGVITQLTGANAPVATTNGLVYLPGGILMQWGINNVSLSGHQSGTVTFSASNIAFPNACFNVSLTLITTSTSNTTTANNLSVRSVSATGFTWLFNGNGTPNFSGFYWTAIGN